MNIDDIMKNLPEWYNRFLMDYNSLKNEKMTYYFGMDLDHIHGQLGTNTLFRPDDDEQHALISISKQTEKAIKHLQNFHPTFKNTDSLAAIAWNGYCNNVGQWDSYSIIFTLKKENTYEVHAINTDSRNPPKLVHADFNHFFINLSETIALAKDRFAQGFKNFRREGDQLVELNTSFYSINVNKKAIKTLNSIIKDKFFVGFDSEGFEEMSDYETLVQTMMKMTGLSYTITASEDKKTLLLAINSASFQLTPDLDTDQFDERLIMQLNTIIAEFNLDKKFIEVYPGTIHSVDQNTVIAFANEKEIKALKTHGYIH